MVCPNCGSEMSDKKNRCDRCGQDLALYKKILNTADLYYNIGLRKAKVRDLSGAILCLKKSLELNKRHLYARNLLGLIYFEVGETVSAFSEWVISKHFNPNNNDADEYMEMVQENPTRLDTLNQTIKKYNLALTSVKQGNADLAIIQLKKVITLNPRFVKAFQLLALIYIKNEEYDKAKRLLQRANKIDISNETTLQYLKEVEMAQGGKDEGKTSEKEHKSEDGYKPNLIYKEDKPNIMLFINLIIGVIVGVALTYVFVVPTIKKQQSAIENENHIDYSEAKALQETQEKTIISLQQEKDDLAAEVATLKEQLGVFETSDEVVVNYDSLYEATSLYLTELAKKESERDYVSVAKLVAAIDSERYDSEAAKNLLVYLQENVCKQASREVYETGHDKYSKNKFEDALEYLLEALSYDAENVDAMYFIGRSYQRLGNKEQAALYYNKLINDYPESTRAEQAGQFIDEVQD